MAYLKSFFSFFISLYNQKYIIGQLVKRDFQNKHLASYIGLPWAFIQPAVSILVIWFAFTFGLKVGKMESGLPFAPWFICGMIPWLFISETISSTTNSLIEYSYLIKKTSFKVAIIPLIKIFTSLIIHMFFIIIIAIFAMAYGFIPSIYWFQIIYLVFAAFVLLTGLGWLISSINVFVRDIGPIVTVTISILFWATPIIWPYTMLVGKMKYLALLNPFFYITEGYRYAFLGKAWMFQNIEMTIFFWITTITIFISGALVFKKLTPHFADVL
jgi:ABC-type polysaccharide/polyol phosphate export permease